MPLTATKSFCRDRTCQLRLVRPVTDRQTDYYYYYATSDPPSQAHPRPAKILAPPLPPRQNPCAATPKRLSCHAERRFSIPQSPRFARGLIILNALYLRHFPQCLVFIVNVEAFCPMGRLYRCIHALFVHCESK